ncbi:MAG: hypothetical protein R3F11_01695 [Verrucomicrobiales bacterium]
MTRSPRMTGAATWRPNLVASGTRQSRRPPARSSPIKPPTVKQTTCRTPPITAICGGA